MGVTVKTRLALLFLDHVHRVRLERTRMHIDYSRDREHATWLEIACTHGKSSLALCFCEDERAS